MRVFIECNENNWDVNEPTIHQACFFSDIQGILCLWWR